MDLPRLVRRLSSYSLDEPTSNPLASVAPTPSRSSSTGLTVDTTVAKPLSFRKVDGTTPTVASPFSREPTPSSARSLTSHSSNADDDHDHVLRRRRSNSECLLLAKTNGTQELPGPCKEYISSVKQILARSSEDARPAARRRSMSMRTNSAASIREGMALH
jgi:hypothetical protein